MKFFDLHLHVNSTESRLEDLAKTAKLLGYHGICAVFYYEDWEKRGFLIEEIEKMKKEVGIEVYLGFEARNLKELKELSKKRKYFDVLLVKGGNVSLNRIACQTPEVDILTHPEHQRSDTGLDHVSLRFAAENEVAVEVNFREILTSNKTIRAKILHNMKKNVKLAIKYKTPLVISSGATNHWELRSPECLASFGTLFDLGLKEAKEAISTVPEKIVKRSEERKSEKWIMPGVKIVE